MPTRGCGVQRPKIDLPVGAAHGQDAAVGREGHALAHRAADGRRVAAPQVDDGHRAGRLADRGREAAHGQGVAVGRKGQADRGDALADRLGRLTVVQGAEHQFTRLELAAVLAGAHGQGAAVGRDGHATDRLVEAGKAMATALRVLRSQTRTVLSTLPVSSLSVNNGADAGNHAAVALLAGRIALAAEDRAGLVGFGIPEEQPAGAGGSGQHLAVLGIANDVRHAQRQFENRPTAGPYRCARPARTSRPRRRPTARPIDRRSRWMIGRPCEGSVSPAIFARRSPIGGRCLPCRRRPAARRGARTPAG